MKKIISITLAIAVLLSCSVMVSASENRDIQSVRETLISQGMPEDIVMSLPDTEIAKYTNVNEESITEHYYKFTPVEAGAATIGASSSQEYTVEEVSKQECMSAVSSQNGTQARGTIGSSYMQTTINATKISGRRYLISATYKWISTPIFKLTDYFALTIHDCMVLVPDTEYTLEQNDCISVYGAREYTNSWTDSLKKSGIGGHCMAVHMLPSDEYFTYHNFRGYMSFEAEIAEVGSNGVVNFAAYITYAHQTLVPSIGLSITLPKSVSATITPKISFDYLTDQENWTHRE